MHDGGVLMDRKLLFISKYPDIIQEFLIAMDGKEIAIDVASNGIEAVTMLKKSEYQVVVTGISLDGYNGEQIITYLNKNFPNTVCIIYTTSISPTQLHFFINERNVFRVFLRPVDFHQKFFAALEDAFEYYDVRVANQEEEASRGEEIEKKAQECVEIREKLARQKQTKAYANRYMKRMTQLSLQAYAEKFTMEQKEILQAGEWKVIDLCFGAEGPNAERLEAAEDLARKVKAKMSSVG